MSPEPKPAADCPTAAVEGTGDSQREVWLGLFNFRLPAVSRPDTDMAEVQMRTQAIEAAVGDDVYSSGFTLETGQVKTEQLAYLLKDCIVVGVHLNLHGTPPSQATRSRWPKRLGTGMACVSWRWRNRHPTPPR